MRQLVGVQRNRGAAKNSKEPERHPRPQQRPCLVAGNGAPDCKAGADKLCQSKGYKEGKSLNADSAEKCSAKVLIPGRQRKPDDCRTDTYVTRALCQ